MEWISVKDRLPKEGEENTVLVCYIGFISETLCVATGFIDDTGLWRWGESGNRVKVRITHWMPLPEPPKK